MPCLHGASRNLKECPGQARKCKSSALQVAPSLTMFISQQKQLQRLVAWLLLFAHTSENLKTSSACVQCRAQDMGCSILEATSKICPKLHCIQYRLQHPLPHAPSWAQSGLSRRPACSEPKTDLSKLWENTQLLFGLKASDCPLNF